MASRNKFTGERTAAGFPDAVSQSVLGVIGLHDVAIFSFEGTSASLRLTRTEAARFIAPSGHSKENVTGRLEVRSRLSPEQTAASGLLAPRGSLGKARDCSLWRAARLN
jgi:hypothetical protein